MKNTDWEKMHVVGLAPSTWGVGFAVFHAEKLVDWGLMTVQGNKNSQSLARVEKLMLRYRPRKIFLEDYWAEGSRRAPRIRELGKQIMAAAHNHQAKVKLLPRKRIRSVFLGREEGTKHQVAEAVANRFPEELGDRLPPTRRDWMSEDSRMPIFDAVALVVAAR